MLGFLLDCYIIYLFNQQCFSFAETRHASGLKPLAFCPGLASLNIVVGLVFSGHFFDTVISVMQVAPSALGFFRVRALIVISNNFFEPFTGFVTIMMILWFFLQCGLFQNEGGLDKLIADSSEAKLFYANNEVFLGNQRSSSSKSQSDKVSKSKTGMD